MAEPLVCPHGVGASVCTTCRAQREAAPPETTTGDNALKACARELLAAEFEAVGQPQMARFIRTYREDGYRSKTHVYACAIRAIEKALTRSPVEDARGELVEALKPFKSWLLHIEATGSRRLADNEYVCVSGAPNMGELRRLAALAKSLPSPRGWQDARNEVLEKAALIAELWMPAPRGHSSGPATANEACPEIASRIRALKSLPSLLESPSCK